MMSDLTMREILDAFARALDETRRKIDRGEIRGDGRFAWPPTTEPADKPDIEKLR
jgi:hypothetical protein